MTAWIFFSTDTWDLDEQHSRRHKRSNDELRAFCRLEVKVWTISKRFFKAAAGNLSTKRLSVHPMRGVRCLHYLKGILGPGQQTILQAGRYAAGKIEHPMDDFLPALAVVVAWELPTLMLRLCHCTRCRRAAHEDPYTER